MCLRNYLIALIIVSLFPGMALAKTIRVPLDYTTIQAAVNAVDEGDVILIAPGVYKERIKLDGKNITLASHFLQSGDDQDIHKTVLHGRGKNVLTIKNAGLSTRIIGLTIRNGNDGIQVFYCKIQILFNRFINNRDGIDYEGGGGICKGNYFENNRDDAIDLDGSCEVTIEDNIVRNSKDDGIEIRLHLHKDPPININILRNVISGNKEDGIQIIHIHDGFHSERVFRIEHNVISDNAMAGVGCMGKGNTKENYEGANIPEQIFIVNNTFVNNPYGVSGGDNMVVLNNIFVGAKKVAMSKVDGNSIAGYNLFWMNQTNVQYSNWVSDKTLFKDPMLDDEYRLTPNSPCVDAGASSFHWKGRTLLSRAKHSYSGVAPDVGAFELE